MAILLELYYDVGDTMSPLKGGHIMQRVRRLLTVALTLAVLLAVPVMAAAQGTGGQVTHTVQAGENLTRIALQ